MRDDIPTSDDIRREMRALRSNLGKEAQSLVENARVMTDWHYIVRQAPWLFLGGAGALGYLLVPAKTRYIKPSPEQLADLARSHGVAFPPARKQSLLSTAAHAAGAALLRSGVAIAGQQLNALVARALTPPARSPNEPVSSQRQSHES